MVESPVTHEQPDSPIHMAGTDHVTVWGSNEEATVEFYRDLLGMPLVLRQPNLDDPSQTHLFFDTGDGTILTFFVHPDRESNAAPQQTQVGGVHHLAFKIEPDRFRETMDALDGAGKHYSVFDRGIFHSLYTRDHDGLVIELTTDKYEFPDDRRGEILAKTQQIRVEDGADYAEDRHMEAALEELGLPVEKNDLPDADRGAGV